MDPSEVPVSQAGLLRKDYTPGDIGFDPLGLKPLKEDELKDMQTKELQSKSYRSTQHCVESHWKRSLSFLHLVHGHSQPLLHRLLSTHETKPFLCRSRVFSLDGRLAMLAAAGCLAQELANGQGILENLGISAHL